MEDPFDEDNELIALTGPPPWFEEHGISRHSIRNSSDVKQLDNNAEFEVLREQAGEVARLFAIVLLDAASNREQLLQLRTVLDRASKDLSALIHPSD
jgi:hypothetical protein